MPNVLWPNGSANRPTVTSPFGWRIHPITGIRTLHAGIDLIGWSIIKSPVPGTVTFAGYNGGAGNEVRIRADGPNAFVKGDVFRMLHNRELWVRTGQRVSQGQQVAVMGTTGSSTGVHCHFETRPDGGSAIDPNVYMANANAGTSGGGTNPTPKPEPKPTDPNTEEEEEMAGNSGFYYTEGSGATATIVYLIVNNDRGTYHEYSNGQGNGAMPSAYNNAIAAAYRTGNFAPITAGHARVIKAQNQPSEGAPERIILDWDDVEFAKFLAALDSDGVAASASQIATFAK